MSFWTLTGCQRWLCKLLSGPVRPREGSDPAGHRCSPECCVGPVGESRGQGGTGIIRKHFLPQVWHLHDSSWHRFPVAAVEAAGRHGESRGNLDVWFMSRIMWSRGKSTRFMCVNSGSQADCLMHWLQIHHRRAYRGGGSRWGWFMTPSTVWRWNPFFVRGLSAKQLSMLLFSHSDILVKAREGKQQRGEPPKKSHELHG